MCFEGREYSERRSVTSSGVEGMSFEIWVAEDSGVWPIRGVASACGIDSLGSRKVLLDDVGSEGMRVRLWRRSACLLPVIRFEVAWERHVMHGANGQEVRGQRWSICRISLVMLNVFV